MSTYDDYDGLTNSQAEMAALIDEAEINAAERDRMAHRPHGYHAGLVRAVAELIKAPEPITVAELAELADLSKSRAGDIVRALDTHDALTIVRARPKTFELASLEAADNCVAASERVR